MIWVLRNAFAMLDSWTKRRVAVSAVVSLVLALFESAAFAVIYLVLDFLTNTSLDPEQRFPFLRTLLGNQDRSSVIRILTIFGVTFFLTKSVCSALAARWQAGVQATTEARLSSRLYAEYLGQSYLRHVARNSSELIRNLTASIGIMASSVLGSFITATTDGTILAGIFVTLVLLSPLLGVVIAVYLTAIVAGYLLVLSPSIQRAAARDQQLTSATLQLMSESFAGIKAVKAFGVTRQLSARYGGQRLEVARAHKTLNFAQRLPQYYLEVCMVVGISVAALTLNRVSSQGHRTALLGILVASALRALPSVNRMLNSINSIRSGRAAVENLARASALDDGSAPAAVESQPVPTLSRAISLENLSFHYPETARPALDEVNLTIQVGTSMGVVGPSGAGKSTLVDLLLGLLSPTSGSLAIDGLELTPERVDSWREQIGYVPQETFLMDNSIRANVAFYRDVDDEAIIRALGAAQLSEFVATLPDGLDTRVGEHGARLSGGQRQRLGIARALLLRPTVLVLDEATSALDGATESAVTATVNQLHGSVTIVIIAHRLSTVRACDRILLIEGGQIGDEGTFDELLDRNDHFMEMVRHARV